MFESDIPVTEILIFVINARLNAFHAVSSRQMEFREWKVLYYDYNLTQVCS